MKSKKILGLLLVVTLLSATVFGTASVFAAGAQTNVQLESYMPPVKTVFVDDDFENRTVGESVAPIAEGQTGYRANQISSAVAGILAEKDNENILASFNSTYKALNLCKKNISAAAKKLVISFKLNLNNVTVSGGNVLLRGDTSTKAFMFQKSSANKGLTIKIYDSTGGTPTWSTVNGINDNWIDVALILEKNGENAECKNIFINGNDIAASKSVTDKKLATGFKWWQEGSTTDCINISSSSAQYAKIDNILIYEPYDVYITDVNTTDRTVKIVNNGSTSVSGKVFLALYDDDNNLVSATEKTDEVTVAAGANQTVTLDGEISTTGAAKAKIFFWNKATLAPLCAPAEV